MRKLHLYFFMMLVICFTGGASVSYAQTVPAGTCTWDGAFNESGFKMVSIITDQISCILFGEAPGGTMSNTGACAVGDKACGCTVTQTVSYRLFSSISDPAINGSFNQIMRIALVLYVLFYGISFVLGIVQTTISDFLPRVAKIAVVIAFTTPNAWANFYTIFGRFFKGGMDSLISMVTGGNGVQGPFATLDQAISAALSAKMFVTIVATVFSGPYGLILGFLLITSLGTFIGTLMQAIWVYLMALVMLAFLLGLGPIFILCILFSKTRHLFDGWLNQLINAMLQPVFLFTFFAFFIQLVLGAMSNILSVDVCYMPTQGLFRGTPTDMVMPRFTYNGQPYGGPMSWDTPFPLSVFDILAFLILTQLAWRFNGIVLNIASEIASASTNLNMQGGITSMFSPGQVFTSRANAAASAATRRLTVAGRNTVEGSAASAANVANKTREQAQVNTGRRPGGNKE